VLTTLRWHGRSGAEVAARYGGDRGDEPPPGMEALPFPAAGETMYWIPAARALVPGDRIIGAAGGGLRLCPESWLHYLEPGLTLADLRVLLRPLLELPVEHVLVSHGEPVLHGGGEALASALR